MSQGTSAPSRRGFTLVEAVFCLVITGGLLVAALHTLAALARREHTLAQHELALALAQDLAGEVLQSAYADANETHRTFGLEPGESAPGEARQLFDDVDDYHGWTSTPPTTRAGDAVSGGDGLERRVTVEYVTPEAPEVENASATVDTGLKRITIEVLGDGTHASIVVLRSRHGNADQEPREASTFVRSVTIGLRLGEDGQYVSTGTNVLNQVALEDAP